MLSDRDAFMLTVKIVVWCWAAVAIMATVHALSMIRLPGKRSKD